MNRNNIINAIDRLLVKDGISRWELSWEHQRIEINDTKDLPTRPTGLLRALLHRAKALDQFFNNPDLLKLTDTPNGAECHELIYHRLTVPEHSVSKRRFNLLLKLLRHYHTSLIGVNLETGHWSKNINGNDAFTIASKKYLMRFYELVPRVQHRVEEVHSKYVVAYAQNFGTPVDADIQQELLQLAIHVCNHANPDSINMKYFKQSI